VFVSVVASANAGFVLAEPIEPTLELNSMSGQGDRVTDMQRTRLLNQVANSCVAACRKRRDQSNGVGMRLNTIQFPTA
jgi:hypothetical protein